MRAVCGANRTDDRAAEMRGCCHGRRWLECHAEAAGAGRPHAVPRWWGFVPLSAV